MADNISDTDAASTARPTQGWPHGRTGVWFIGARGSVATTATIGIHALAAGLVPPTGCSTTSAAFDGVPLPAFADLVIGGHDISTTPLVKKAESLTEAGMIPPRVVSAVHDGLATTEAELRPAYDPRTATGSQRAEIDRLAADITDFKQRHGLGRVIVIDIASTEPILADAPEFHDRALLESALADENRSVLPASSVTALAAITAGCPFVSFTPSPGLNLPVLIEIAEEAGLPFAGQDGKTGETLLRTVLAPMFTARGMRVMSWAGTNLLGGGDGATLADPEAVRSKLASKNRGLHDLLGDDVVTPLHIDNVPDLGDIKTAWDHVHVEGFLSSRMTLQTTWSGYDSALAAPLVIDLARLMALAHAAGLSGPIAELGFFFKDPWGSNVHGFAEQTTILTEWAHRTGRQL